MSNTAFVGAVMRELNESGIRISDGDPISMPIEQFAQFLSQHNLEVVQQFVRMQRKVGIQTVRYASDHRDNISSIDCLVERMAEEDLILDHDKANAAAQLRMRIVDIEPVVDERLFQLCNQHRQLCDFGLESPKPL